MASFSHHSPRQGHSSRPIGIRPNQPFPSGHSLTPPYTSAEEGYPSSSTSRSLARPMMIPRPTYPLSSYTDTLSFPGKWMNPRTLHMHSQPDSSPAFPSSQFGSSSTLSNTDGFNFYPHSFPINPYMQPPQSDALPDLAFDPNFALIFDESDNETAPAPKSSKPPPRPPNAWIIYRSDMLKAIAEGRHIPGLDAVMAESGVSSGESPADEATDGGASRSEGEGEGSGALPVAKKKPKQKKPKKGSKEPTAGMLTLGKGKTGRGIPQADVSKLISMMWARETPENKKKYERQSELQKIEHQRKYPDYKFQPQKRADKLREREEREKAKLEARAAKKQEKQALTRAKRKGRSKPPPPSPYASASGMARSASGPSVKDEFGAYPFPFPQENVPSMQASDLPFPEAGSSKAMAWSAAPRPPPPVNPPTWTNIPDVGPATVVPYIFEPILAPGDSIDLLRDLPTEESDADALAALWCAVEEEPVGEAGDPSNAWDVTGAEAMELWSELGSFPQIPGSLDLSSATAHETAQGWSQMQGVPFEGYAQPIHEQGMSTVQIPYVEPALRAGDAAATSGPFLSTNQPLSPLEAWSTQGIEAGGTLRQALSGTAGNRMPSTRGSVSGLPISPDTSEIPRHVSSSAFPPTPLSVETAGWSDRSISFSAFASQIDHGDTDDVWGEDEIDTKVVAPTKVAQSQTGPSTPIESAISSITNTSGSSSDVSTKSGPPRGVRRPRAVGASFVEQPT